MIRENAVNTKAPVSTDSRCKCAGAARASAWAFGSSPVQPERDPTTHINSKVRVVQNLSTPERGNRSDKKVFIERTVGE